MRWLLWCCLGLLPAIAGADSVFTSPASDRSLAYLGYIFGGMSGLPVAGGSGILGQLMQLLNALIFSLGIIIVVYTGMTSVLNTAQEGEVLGKKLSAIWTPVRSGLGIFLLVPTSSGYSFVQVSVMWLIIQGVGAGNAIWGQVLDQYQVGNTLSQPGGTTSSGFAKQETLMKNLLSTAACIEKVNSTSDDLKIFKTRGRIAQAYSDGDKTLFGFPELNMPLCGSFEPKLDTVCSINLDDAQKARFSRQFGRIIEDAVNDISFSAFETNNTTAYTTVSTFISQIKQLQSRTATLGAAIAGPQGGESDTIRQGKADGWITTGSYYFQLLNNNSACAASIDNVQFGYDGINAGSQLGISGFDTRINNNVDNYMAAVSQSPSAATISLDPKKITENQIPRSTIGRDLANSGVFSLTTLGAADSASRVATGTSFLDDMINYFIPEEKPFKPTNKYIKDILNIEPGKDPISALAKWGGSIMQGVEITFFTGLVAMTAFLLVATAYSWQNPMGWTAMVIIALAGPVILLLLTSLFAAGALTGIYVPLVPYLIFTLTAISWVILVVEAIIAAPLMALTVVVPSEDEIGKAGHALVILFGLFLRPALMVVGFVIGSRLLIIGVSILTYGFVYVLAGLTFIGLFANAAIVIIYATMVVNMTTECFSLIYQIPDKLLRWMGGSPESSSITEQLRGVRSGFDKGTKSSQSVVQGGISAMGGTISSKLEKR